MEGEGYDAKATQFYGRSQTYVYDLLGSNYRKDAVVEKLNAMHPRILQSIQAHRGRRFLEFGGGVGVMCQLAQEWGKEVTYVDLPSLVADFATWRFQRHEWPIRAFLADPQCLRLEGEYDIVFSDAVLEHVADPHQVVRELCAHTAPGALLVLLVDLTDVLSAKRQRGPSLALCAWCDGGRNLHPETEEPQNGDWLPADTGKQPASGAPAAMPCPSFLGPPPHQAYKFLHAMFIRQSHLYKGKHPSGNRQREGVPDELDLC